MYTVTQYWTAKGIIMKRNIFSLTIIESLIYIPNLHRFSIHNYSSQYHFEVSEKRLSFHQFGEYQSLLQCTKIDHL